jgi:hypothetical protein
MECRNLSVSEPKPIPKEAYEPPTAHVFPLQIEERLNACDSGVTCNTCPQS